MTERKLKFAVKKIVEDKNRDPNQQVLTIDIEKEYFHFKPYSYKPAEDWEIGRIIFTFNERKDLYNRIKDNSNFELAYEDNDREIWHDDGNPHGGGVLTDLRVFHKNAVVSSLGSGLIECDFTPENENQIKLEIENEIPFDPAKVRQKSIQNIKRIWKDNSSDGSEGGTINEKNINQVLGTNWESDFANKNTKEDIGEHENKLLKKITTLIESQKIKITFSKESIKPITQGLKKGIKGLKIKLEENAELTFYCHFRKENLTWNVKEIQFLSQGITEPYELLTNEEKEDFELSFNFSEFFYYLKDINISELGGHCVYASESWTGDDGILKVYNYQRLANSWKTGKITLKENDIEQQPNQEDTQKLNELNCLLDAASSSASYQDKIAALKKAGELEGFISPEIQTKITQICQQLSNNLAQFKQALSEKIESHLTANNLTINDLSTENKTLYNDIKTGGVVQATEIQTIEKKLTQAIGAAGAKKNLDNLETQIRKVLSSNDRDEKLRLQKLLRKYLKNNNTFYQAEKIRAQQLNRKLKKSIQENDFNQNSETPWEKIILFSCIGIGLTLIILLVYNLSKSSRRRKYTY